MDFERYPLIYAVFTMIVFTASTFQSLSYAFKVTREQVSFSLRQVHHFSHFLKRKKTEQNLVYTKAGIMSELATLQEQ